MRALKTLLALMGLVIVAGFAFIGYELYQRSTDPNHPRAFGRAEPAAEELMTVLPAGSRIGQMQVLGPRVVYHVTLPDGTEQIHVLDPRDGSIEVRLSAPAAPGGPAIRPPDREPEQAPSISDQWKPPAKQP